MILQVSLHFSPLLLGSHPVLTEVCVTVFVRLYAGGEALLALASHRCFLSSLCFSVTTMKKCPCEHAGLHLHHRMLHMLTPAELKAIHPKRKLRPYVAAAPLHIAEQNTESNTSSQDSDGSEHHPAFGASCTYIWGALLRIDVLEAPADTRFVFFGTGHMQVYACRLFREDEILEFKQTQEGSVEERLVKGASGGVGVPGWDSTEDNSTFAAASVAARGGLRVARMAEIPTQDCVMTVADVTMSGMPGWVSVVSGSQGRVRLRVWAPKGVEVHLRPPIPCPTPLDVAPAW